MLFLLAGFTTPVHITGKRKYEVSKMASVALTRVSGSVLSTSTRSGHFRQGHPRAGEEWRIENLNVLVADQNVTVVSLPRRESDGGFEKLSSFRFDKGDVVDFLTEVSIYNGDVQVRALEDWPKDDISSLAA
jgi:hypothetical protein